MLSQQFSTRRQIVYGGIFATMLICLSVFLFERTLLWLSPQVGSFYEYDPDLGFKVRPYAGGSNAFGFNDRDYPLQKPAGHFRIVVLGDSFGWAGGRDKNYTALLEQRFAKHYGHQRVEVINAGYSKTHTGEQLALLKKYAMQYNPDLVVLGFFCGNDVFEAEPYRKRLVIGGVFVDIDTRLELSFFGSPAPPGVIFLSTLKKIAVQGTELFERFKERLGYLSCKLTQSSACPSRYDAPGTFSHATFLRIEKERLNLFDTRRHVKEKFAANLQLIFEQLSLMRSFLDAHGTHMLVALYPDEFQVSPALLQDILTTYHLDAAHYDLRFIQNAVKQHLDSQEIPVIDLLDGFVAHSKEQSLYLLRNTHWNTAGNRLAADLLFSALLPRAEAFFLAHQADRN